ncbi:MAG: hypothetical protein KatS3mg111_1860 [Pirellulaceae bacterium]|nr:MAG: hypothetical protein KatS3mg111_1860 [Pirellulaceae bacterium]
MKCRSFHARRRGYTLVFFAMMLFGIMALAALVIDIGFARLAQQQLRIAADSAAVEGLRGEGIIDYDDRREAARSFVHWHFDDDLDSTGTYPADDDGAFDDGSGQFGAGPLVQFSGGAGDASLVASQLMEIDRGSPVYKPQVGDGPPSASGSFRVALRRGATDAPDGDLYANGPSVPYLFARGSLIHRQLIQVGMTVRATAEARSTPALSIGMPQEAIVPPLTGLLPLAVELQFWNSLTTGAADIQAVAAGQIGTAGRFFALAGAETMPVTIGRQIPAAASPADGTYVGYVPIYANLTTSGTPRVVAYGWVQVVVNGGGTTTSITRQPSHVGGENVSAVRCYPVSLTAAEAAELVALIPQVEEPLLAPCIRSNEP